MAILEKEKDKNEYIGLMAEVDGEDKLIAFVSPIKGVDQEVLVTKLTEKGLKAEIKESQGDVVDFAL